MSERKRDLGAVVKSMSFDSMKCPHCSDAYQNGDDLRLRLMKVPGGETRVPYHRECAEEADKSDEAAKKAEVEKAKRLRELKAGTIKQPYEGLEFETNAQHFDPHLHDELHGRLTLTKRLDVLFNGEVPRNEQRIDYARDFVGGMDKSLEQVELRGYTRHPRTLELFGIIFAGLDGQLSAELKPVFESILGGREHYSGARTETAEWVSLAIERKKDKIIFYVDPHFICKYDVRSERRWVANEKKELAFKGVHEFTLPKEVTKQVVDASLSRNKHLMVPAHAIGDDFVNFVYGRTECDERQYGDVFSQAVPDKIKASKISFNPRIMIPEWEKVVFPLYLPRKTGHLNDGYQNHCFPDGVLFDLQLDQPGIPGYNPWSWKGRGVRQKSFIKRLFGK